jgi:hypothetical protein
MTALNTEPAADTSAATNPAMTQPNTRSLSDIQAAGAWRVLRLQAGFDLEPAGSAR